MQEDRDRTEAKGLRARLEKTPWGRLSPKGRKRLVRAGIVLGLILLLVVLPSFLGSRPSFFENYADAADDYETWGVSVHAKVQCYDCHVDPGVVSRAAFGLRMAGEFYYARFTEGDATMLERPTNDACDKCHFELRSISPSGDLLVPHNAHVDILEIECVHCHEYLVHEASPEGKFVPRMVMCMECHDGEQAKDTCSVCHTEKAVPDDHKEADWLVVHSDRAETTDCAECHGWTENWCAECHGRRPPTHVDKWRSLHRDQVEERRNCEACHEGPFCIECHGEVPELNFDPTLELATK